MLVDFCTRSSKDALLTVVACAANTHTSRDIRIIPGIMALRGAGPLPDKTVANKYITAPKNSPVVFHGHSPGRQVYNLGGTELDLFVLAAFSPDYQNGHIQLVADWINCIPKDQIFQALMPMGAHDEQIRFHL